MFGGANNMFKELWSRNVRDLLKASGLSTAEAARLVGTSKQYLSTILSDTEPTSTREAVMERLCFLLHTTPSHLFSPQTRDYRDASLAELKEEEAELSPVELAILAERHFLAGEYSKAYVQCCGLLLRHEKELGTSAKAQALLLAGKSGCLAGVTEHSKSLLKEALQLFQKRLATHPDKYIPLCMDCYRYMGLAYYSAGDYREAARWLARVFDLASRYPHIASNLEGKIEEAASNWLRSTIKQGDLNGFLQAAAVTKTTADECSFEELRRLVRVEEVLCFYPLAIVHEDLDTLLCGYSEEVSRLGLEDFGGDALQLVNYILLLRAAARLGELTTIPENAIGSGPDNVALRTVLESLVLIEQGPVRPLQAAQALTKLQIVHNPDAPVALQALNQIVQGLYLESMQLLPESHAMWQTSLGLLRSNKELPLYIYCLDWYLKATALQLPPEERAITTALLTRTVASFERKAGGAYPWR